MKTIVALLCAVMFSNSAFAAIRCVPDGRGGTCCWDTDKDGPFKPLSCY